MCDSFYYEILIGLLVKGLSINFYVAFDIGETGVVRRNV